MPSTWLRSLPIELGSIDNFREPEIEFSSKDHLAGEMDVELKQLYTYLRSLEKSSKRAMMEAELADEDEGKEALKAKASELYRRGELVNVLFWISVNDTFNLWGKKSLGVRKGFKVVWSDEEEPDPRDLLKRLIFGD